MPMRPKLSSVSAIQRYERELYSFLDAKHPEVLAGIREKKELTPDITAKIDGALGDFAKVFSA